jgi:hypothetical protein
MGLLVVVGTYSESEGVHRRPSQDALGITVLAFCGFQFLLSLQEG